MEILIDDKCDICPFLEDTMTLCSLKSRKKNLKYIPMKYKIKYIYGIGLKRPKWCPLKDEEVIIKLNSTQVD